ncbi:MAG: shikimate dehydrogenase [Butyrivibrio sp.]
MNSQTKLCCLIGNPVGHSISPLIHNTLAERMNINLAYTAFSVESDDVGTAVKGAKALGILGMNVTVPHKCEVIPYLDEIDELALHIGAVNTIVSTDKGYKGYNTDITGLGRQLREEGISLKDRDVIILGAGGASKAVTYLCADEGASRIFLLNRSISNAEKLADEVNSFFPDRVVPMELTDYHKIPAGKYPVIQTTSVGLYPNTDKAPIEDEDFYEMVESGVDIIFNPYETQFMKLCRKHGAPAFNGLKMLLYQGIAAFELWNKVVVPKELSEEILNLMEKEMVNNG